MSDQPAARWEAVLLADAGSAFSYPATPDIEAGVRLRLALVPTALPAWRGPIVARAAAVALALVAGLALVVVLSRDVRDVVADFLGLAVEGERIEILPTPRPGETPTPLPTPRTLESFATPTTLESAAARLRFAPALIPGIEQAKAVYIVDYLGLAVVVVQYERSDLWETNGAIFEKGVFGKGVQVIEQVTVNGQPAYWISGGSHIVRVIGSDGREVAGSERTVTRNTLVWRSAGFNYRLETELSEAEALGVAVSLP
jgi:hypothetical protein